MARSDVEIRPVRLEDAADLYEITQQPAVARTMLFLPSMEFAETQKHVSLEDPHRHYLAAVIDGRAVGSVNLSHFTRPRLTHSGQIGLMVHEAYWGQGIGGRLMASALDIADNWLGLRRVQLGVYAGNDAAIHLYEKLGFEREGVKRRAAYGPDGWQDEIVMARLRDLPERPPPAEPHPRPARREPVANLRIRPPQPDDLEEFYDLMRHPDVARTTMQMPSQAIWLSRQRLLQPPPGMHRFAALDNERLIGLITLWPHPRARQAHSAGLGMMVHPHYWGRGVGSALMAAVVDLADNWLNLQRIELEVNTDNPAGVRLYEKFGFVAEGTYRFHAYGGGRWADSLFMARLREGGPDQT